MLSTHRLRILTEVRRTGSIAGAARDLKLSPSAVSHQLAQLEKEAGVRLVERGPKSLRLTSAGRRLSLHSEEILTRLAAAERDLLTQSRADAGRLRIGFFASAGHRLLPQALSRFSIRHPEVELELVEGRPRRLLPVLQQGEIDLLVVFEHPLDPWTPPAGVEVTYLFHEPQLLAVPAGHPAGRRGQVELAELAGEQWITSYGAGAPDRSVLERACALAGFQPKVRCRSDHYEVILGLVRAGMGIALLPTLSLTDVSGVELTRVAGPRLHRRIGVALRPGNPNPMLGSFAAYLGSAAANLRAAAAAAAGQPGRGAARATAPKETAPRTNALRMTAPTATAPTAAELTATPPRTVAGTGQASARPRPVPTS